MTAPTKPLPILDNVSRRWFEAAAQGRLLIQKSAADNTYQWYPRAHVVGSLSPDVDWVEAAGTGRIYSYTIVHRTPNAEFADDCPYVLAIVELDEGVRLSTRIVDTPLDQLRCDLPVRVTFERIDDEITLAYFTATEDAA
jgi:uncharacterized OB-fold protein